MFILIYNGRGFPAAFMENGDPSNSTLAAVDAVNSVILKIGQILMVSPIILIYSFQNE